MSRKSNVDLFASRAYLESRQRQAYQAVEQRRQAALQAMRMASSVVFPRFPGVRRAYIFGSALRPGAMRAASDIDVAVEGELRAEEYFALWRELENAASNWTVDLVELDREVRFAERVRAEGMLIYERPDSDAESGDRSRSEGDR